MVYNIAPVLIFLSGWYAYNHKSSINIPYGYCFAVCFFFSHQACQCLFPYLSAVFLGAYNCIKIIICSWLTGLLSLHDGLLSCQILLQDFFCRESNCNCNFLLFLWLPFLQTVSIYLFTFSLFLYLNQTIVSQRQHTVGSCIFNFFNYYLNLYAEDMLWWYVYKGQRTATVFESLLHHVGLMNSGS